MQLGKLPEMITSAKNWAALLYPDLAGEDNLRLIRSIQAAALRHAAEIAYRRFRETKSAAALNIHDEIIADAVKLDPTLFPKHECPEY